MGMCTASGRVQFRPGMRLTDLIGSLDELKPLADLHYVLIRRETGPTRIVSALSADLAAAFAAPGHRADVMLQSRDTVYVFDLASSRDRMIDADARGTRSPERRAMCRSRSSRIGGRVKVPGHYPLEPGMTVSDLLRAGGGLDQAAFGGQAELTRHQIVRRLAARVAAAHDRPRRRARGRCRPPTCRCWPSTTW